MIRKAAAEKKKREEKREDAKRAALAALSPTLPAMLGAAGAGAGAGGQEKDMPDTRPRSVESQQHFRALLENAKVPCRFFEACDPYFNPLRTAPRLWGANEQN